MPTFQCTAQCHHCGTASSPRERTWLGGELLRRAIDEAAAAGYERVIFTGGEPTLAGPELLDAMRHARSRGLLVKLVTNGHWAESEASAAAHAARFRKAGLAEANVSTGDEHVRFVPLQTALRAARALVAEAVPVTIILESSDSRRLTLETLRSAAERGELDGVAVQSSAWSPVSAWGKLRYPPSHLLNRSTVEQRSGCEDMLSVTTVQADGTISPCCGLGIRFVPELRLGNLRETTLGDAVREASADALKALIAAEGPERLLAWAATQDPTIEWENHYAHRCQACIRIHKDAKVRKALEARLREPIRPDRQPPAAIGADRLFPSARCHEPADGEEVR